MTMYQYSVLICNAGQVSATGICYRYLLQVSATGICYRYLLYLVDDLVNNAPP